MPSPCKGEGRGPFRGGGSTRPLVAPQVRRHASRGVTARLESSHGLVMPGLDPGIHAFLSICQDVERMLPRSHPSISGVSLHAAFEQKM
jgi:hypothetical protein